MSKFQSKTSIDGKITDTADATIPVMDRGFLYGDSVYEVFRTYSGVPLFLDEHHQRLQSSAARIHMHISQSREELDEEIRQTVLATGADDATDVYVRYTVTRGEGPVDLYPNPDLKTRTVIVVKEVPVWNPEFYRLGMSMAIPATRRNPINSLDPNIKGGNYLNNILCVTEARDFGADDCLILNRDGLVTECSNSNAWFVLDGELVTPGPASGNLAGLTRQAIHKACADIGIKTREMDLHASQLPSVSECFVSSATREIMPVNRLRLENGEWLSFPDGGGELTRQAAAGFKEYIQKYVKDNSAYKLL